MPTSSKICKQVIPYVFPIHQATIHATLPSMLDPDLKEHLIAIEKELVQIRRSSGGYASNLMRGILYGAGYVLGVALIIVIIGWVLNKIGVIPQISNQVNAFRAALDRIGGGVK